MSDPSEDTPKKDNMPPSPETPVVHGIQPVEDEQSDASLPPPQDVSLDAALSADVEKQKKKGRRALPNVKLEKKHKIILGAGIGIFLIVLAIYSGRPQQGSMAYGICSTFLELNTPYPHTIRHISLEGSRTAVRIYYTNVDPFGEFKQEMIECTYGAAADGGMQISQITRNRKPVDPQMIVDFNKILPTVVASDPYRVPPPNWKNPLLPE